MSEPPLTANSSVCDGLTMTSWSESNGPRANVGVIPSPPVGNGEPGSGVRLPSFVPGEREDRVPGRVVALDVDDVRSACRRCADASRGVSPPTRQERSTAAIRSAEAREAAGRRLARRDPIVVEHGGRYSLGRSISWRERRPHRPG